MRSRDLTAIRAEMQEAARVLTNHLDDPPFPYSVGFPPNYEALLSGDLGRVDAPAALLDVARTNGRVLIHASAGSGKTYVLVRLFERAAQSWLGSFIDLRKWTPEMFDVWDENAHSDIHQMALLLRELASPSADEFEMASRVDEKTMWFVFVDGLNEVPSRTALQVLEALDAFARRRSFASVLVTDRVTRRQLPSDRWALATIPELAAEQVAALLEDKQAGPLELLTKPFFLNRALKERVDSSTESEWFRDFYTRQLGLSEPELDDLAVAAFQAYELNKARSFKLSSLDETAGKETVHRLTEGGVLSAGKDGRFYFTHHLYHDFLVALYLVQDKLRWDTNSFNTATFRASSFDVLALALALLSDPSDADRFIRNVFDWNPYAPAYSIAASSRRGGTAVSPDMKTAVASMLAERRWDPIAATAESGADALRLLGTAWAKRLLAASSLDEVVSALAETAVGESFQTWRDVFIGYANEHYLVEELGDEDSLVGWTSANVLKRGGVASEHAQELFNLLNHGSSTIRWRVVHVLGAFPTHGSVVRLLNSATEDKEYWVRSGAIRSLVELAGRDSRLRPEIFDLLLQRLDEIVAADGLPDLKRVLVLREPPADWVVYVAPLLESLWATADSVEGQDELRELALRIDRASASAPT